MVKRERETTPAMQELNKTLNELSEKYKDGPQPEDGRKDALNYFGSQLEFAQEFSNLAAQKRREAIEKVEKDGDWSVLKKQIEDDVKFYFASRKNDTRFRQISDSLANLAASI